MKSCPKCNRTFPDETQKFCTYDGGLLISSQPFDPNATVRTTVADIAPPSAASQDETDRDLAGEFATIINNPGATIGSSRETAPTSGQTAIDLQTPTPPAPTPPPVVPPTPEVQSPSVPGAHPTPSVPGAHPTPSVPGAQATPSVPGAQTTPVQQAPETVVGVRPPTAVQAKPKSKLPLIIGGLVLLLLLGGGALTVAFFFVVKPMLDQGNREVATETPTTNQNDNAIATTSPIVDPSPAVEEFVPPPGTVQFINSEQNLDGKLAENYFDFSFYYPQNWSTDPKAGVPGAANFASVERRLPPDFTQESFSVGWYISAGTFVADLPNFPRRTEEFSSSLAKDFPEYQKVSEGPTKINSMDAYEFRWKGLSRGTEKGDIQLWGRVVFLPTGVEGDTSGATLTMLTTSLAGELSSVEDVGERGEMPVILESFRFGKKQ